MTSLKVAQHVRVANMPPLWDFLLALHVVPVRLRQRSSRLLARRVLLANIEHQLVRAANVTRANTQPPLAPQSALPVPRVICQERMAQPHAQFVMQAPSPMTSG